MNIFTRPRMFNHFRDLATRNSRAARPDEVCLELMEMIFSSLLPLLVMGAALVGSGALVVSATGDRVLAGLTVLALVTTIVRAAVVIFVRRLLAARRSDIAAARAWERRYALGSFTFAVVLGAFGARTLSIDYEPADMLVTSLIFAYGAGVVTRMSIRPWICIPSLLLAVIPIVVASAMQSTLEHWAHAFLLLLFMVASLESVRHIYRTTVRQIETRREMAGLARHDNLTGLPNRLLLRERFIASLRQSEESGTLVGVHYLDLDLFKQVNDRFGHRTGDDLLAAVALRLLRLTRTEDTVARIGGDEFLVVQVGINHRDEAEILARRMIRDIAAAYEIRGNIVHVSVSVGVALAPLDGVTIDELIACADKSLYSSKSLGRGGVSFFAETASVPVQPVGR
ncbi:GGDEF domain-containing protein [Microvirga brassicacearum]|uniref:GGDEF domain-containing protein n=1 Tax=Microvirga brassicacearum TaxID=2580413 RepID=A0A5N3P5R9_9HYPH|nr:GGDEF domain-containing protein [Microvirga brassicacearum]KAB0265078.1 GGDEF domain-containing protein [Microvirga brassicacearum]